MQASNCRSMTDSESQMLLLKSTPCVPGLAGRDCSQPVTEDGRDMKAGPLLGHRGLL